VVVAVHTIKTSWKKTIFDDSFGENPWGKPPQKNSRKPTKDNIWRLFGKALLTKPKKPRETQKNKKKKTFQRMFGLRLMLGFFWFCLVFFCFLLVLTLKKLKKLKVFCFLDKMMVKEV